MYDGWVTARTAADGRARAREREDDDDEDDDDDDDERDCFRRGGVGSKRSARVEKEWNGEVIQWVDDDDDDDDTTDG